MPNYGDPKYWEERYKLQKGSTFDWLEDYETLKTIIDDLKLDKTKCKILNLGCGNSEFSEHMYDDGYRNIENVDISENVVKFMVERNKNRDMNCKFDMYLYKNIIIVKVMDVRDMTQFSDNSFDFAVDKSTIDALLCGEKSFINVALMMKEVQRVLKSGGIYMIISYGQPENRIFHLEREHLSFDISIYTIKKDYTVDDLNQKFEKVGRIEFNICNILLGTLCIHMQKKK
jgi:ubiquinone/menaquinone biosynthesis C-methylase UbiE